MDAGLKEATVLRPELPHRAFLCGGSSGISCAPARNASSCTMCHDFDRIISRRGANTVSVEASKATCCRCDRSVVRFDIGLLVDEI